MITKSAVKKKIKKINASNKAFEKASPAEQRVMLAKDVLKQLKLSKINPVSGCFFQAELDKDVKSGQELQSLLKTIPVCNVCALGSLYLSYVTFADNCKIDKYEIDCFDNIDLSMSQRIRELKCFTYNQRALIEMTFEGGEGKFRAEDLKIEQEKIDAGLEFYNSYCAEEDRLVAIMENIIKNEGEFIP